MPRTSLNWKLLLPAAALAAAGIGAAALRGTQGDEPLATVDLHAHESARGAQAMCPWREPERDMAALFPGATGYTTDLLVLSHLRLAILKRLGPGARLDSNALYVYRVARGSERAGTVLVRRVSGEYGAIEVVVGVDANGRVEGARIQRHREPPETAASITSARWLGAFRGKTADARFEPGEDLPPVPPSAQASARAVAQAVRSLLVEYEAGEAAHRHEG